MTDKQETLQILVIENNLEDYILIENYLNEIQQEVYLERAITFEDAKNILGTTQFDAILLDLSLPDIDCCEILVKDCVVQAGRAAVIVLTGYR